MTQAKIDASTEAADASIKRRQRAEPLERHTEPTPWLNTREAAAYIGSTYCTVKAWRSFGTGPKYHCVRQRMIRYHKDDLDFFLRNSSTPQPERKAG